MKAYKRILSKRNGVVLGFLLLVSCESKCDKLDFDTPYKRGPESLVFHRDGTCEQVFNTCRMRRISKYSINSAELVLEDFIVIQDLYHCDGLDTSLTSTSVYKIGCGHIRQGDTVYEE